MNVKQLIESSLRLIGVTGEGSSLSPDQYNDALFALNTMLASWSASFYLVNSQTINTYPITSGKNTYTMGVENTNDWVIKAPVRVETVMYKTSNTEFEIKIVKESEFATFSLSNLSSMYPTDVLIQYNRNNTFNFWPKPQSNGNVVVYAWSLLPEYEALTDTINLPAGYIQAIKFNLALELAPEYGITPLPTVYTEAARSLNAIMDENSTRKPYKISYDGYTKKENIASRTHGFVV